MSYAPVPTQPRPAAASTPTQVPLRTRLKNNLWDWKRHLDQRPEQMFVLVFVTLFVVGTGSFVLYMLTGDFDDATTGGSLDNDIWAEEGRRFEAYLKPVMDKLDLVLERLDKLEDRGEL